MMREKESNAAVRRSHRIVKLLASRFFYGATNKELAEAIGTSAVNISRDMKTLLEIGYAAKLDNGRWALTSVPLAVMQSYTNHSQNLQNRMAETGRNILSGAASLSA